MGTHGIPERMSFNQGVPGSSPGALTNEKPRQINDLAGLEHSGVSLPFRDRSHVFPTTAPAA